MALRDLVKDVKQAFGSKLVSHTVAQEALTIEIHQQDILEVCQTLRDQSEFDFAQLIDLCGVDYLHYGVAEWKTEETTVTGYSRAVDRGHHEKEITWDRPRFAVVYHLLSLENNQRIRVRAFVERDDLCVDSVITIWEVANWYEREAFDLYGILFKGHPDLRRILTDYGFTGHPFRKDFPLIGQVEMRYDATLERCVYEPVSIEPRTLVPKTIRVDNRYLRSEPAEGK